MNGRRDLARAAEYVAARRGELGLTQAALAEAGGIDVKTIYNLESATRWPQARNRDAIEKALGWQAGDLQRVASGYEPTPPLRKPAMAARASAGSQGGGPSPTVAAGEREPRVDVSIQRWFVAEVERRGRELVDITEPLDTLRGIADHNGQTLAELLLEAGLVHASELSVREQPVQPSTAVESFRQDVQRITASPHLSRRAKRDIESKADEILKIRKESDGDA